MLPSEKKDAFLLKARKLTVGYDGKALIEDIDVSLARGHVLTLIGPNGAGKSTILKTLSKQLERLSGQIYIGGSELQQLGDKELSQRMSLLLTERVRTERMSCAEVVESGRYPYTDFLGVLRAEDRRQIEEAMELVHIRELAEQDFMRVSDGQRQRVLLARAICQEPEVMVLDEPTSFLDIRYQLECLALLRSLAKERQLAILLSLHELALAQKVSDEVLCVKDGQIVHYGSAESAFTRERIRDLYGLEGSYNPHFGNLERKAAQTAPKIFIIAGGGSGIPLFRRLEKQGLSFACGVLHSSDIDAELAHDLAAVSICEQPFHPISDEKLREAEEVMATCSCVSSTLRPEDIGPGNMANLRLIEAAKSSGKFVAPEALDLAKL